MRDYKAISLKNVVLSYLSLLISEYFLFCGLKSPEGLNSGQVLLKYASKSGSSCTTTICHSFSKIFSYFSLCHITCWSLNSIVVLHNKVPWSPWNPLCFFKDCVYVQCWSHWWGSSSLKNMHGILENLPGIGAISYHCGNIY